MHASRHHGTGLRGALWRWWHGSTDVPQVKDPPLEAGQSKSLAGRWPDPAGPLARRITATQSDGETEQPHGEASIGRGR
jgi:hypothetical protein